MNVIVQACLALVIAGSLAGCNSTIFDSIPVTAASCNPGIAGDWQRLPDKKNEDASRVEVKVDKECKQANVTFQWAPDQQPDDKTLALHFGREGTWDYAWVDVPQAQEKNDPEVTGFYLMRYRLAGDQLELYFVDDVAIEKEIFDDKLFGTTHLHNHRKIREVKNTVDDLDLQTFNSKITFLSKPWRFERQREKPAQ